MSWIIYLLQVPCQDKLYAKIPLLLLILRVMNRKYRILHPVNMSCNPATPSKIVTIILKIFISSTSTLDNCISSSIK